jgi:S-adenosylmethionine-dependent methyltransferase
MNKNAIKNLLRTAVYGSLMPSEIARNQRPLSNSARTELKTELRRHYFSQPLNFFATTPEKYLAGAEGINDMEDHLEVRLDTHRRRVIPWLNAARPLAGSRVLEIGCGTGASTIALAEQGAEVTAVDVNEGNLFAAEARCRIYNLEAKFLCANAINLHEHFEAGDFDFIIFFATLEHLTYAERISAMRSTWAMLKPSGLWCVVDTPNRLWWYDSHTALLPFFNWLPDDLALDYAPHSEREFMKCYAMAGRAEDVKLDFARRGRGVSYHEFDLAMGPSASINVVSALELYLRDRSVAIRLKARFSKDRQFEAVLKKLGPPIHSGFYQHNLDLIMRK